MNTQTNSTLAQPIHPLRLRMIEDMTLRKMKHHVQTDYLRHVRRFAEFLGRSPEKSEAEDLRRFFIALEKQGISAASINIAISALSFFFKATLNQPDMMRLTRRLRQPVVLPEILLPTEVYQLS